MRRCYIDEKKAAEMEAKFPGLCYPRDEHGNLFIWEQTEPGEAVAISAVVDPLRRPLSPADQASKILNRYHRKQIRRPGE